MKVHPMMKQALTLLALTAVSSAAFAQSSGGFNSLGLGTLACTIIDWLTGELAIIVFFIVGIATFLVGMMMKMDWAKIVALIVMFGLLQGFTGLFGTYIQNNTLSCIA